MENNAAQAWKRFQQILGQCALEIFKNIGPPLDTVNVEEMAFAAWSKEPQLPVKYPAVVSINYGGNIQGTLWFVFSQPLASRVAQAFLDRPLPESGPLGSDFLDAMAEVANQLTGEINTRLRKLYGDNINVLAPKPGVLPDILRADDAAYLGTKAVIALLQIDPTRSEVLAILPDSNFARAFTEGDADKSAGNREPASAVAAGGAKPAAAGPAGKRKSIEGGPNIDLIMDIKLDVTLRMGSRKMPLKDIMGLSSGVVIELDKSITDPVEVRINEKPIAYGEVVVVEGNYAIRITEIANRVERIQSLG